MALPDFDGANNCFGLLINRNQKLHRELYIGNAISEANDLILPEIRNDEVSKKREIELTHEDIE